MNDFEAPQLDDTAPPRMFRTITTRAVAYNMDFVSYLIDQEQNRRSANGQQSMTHAEAAEFQRQLVNKLIIRGDAEAAIALRPVPHVQQQLNG